MRKPASGFRLIFGYLGIFLIFEGLVTLCPLITLIFYPEESKVWLDFAIPAFGAIIIGAILFFTLIARRPKGRFGRNEDALLLVLLWISAIVLGSLPFYLTKFSVLNYGDTSLDLGMSYSECFFESMSGYSATGLTVLPNKVFLDLVDSSSSYSAPHIFLFHRAFMQFIGGVGLVLIVAGALSDRYNLKLYFAEGHNDKLMPNLGKSAKVIFGIYFGYIVIGSISFYLAGMTPFDAICHSIAAIATGGFSTRGSGIVYFQTASSGNGILPVNAIAIEIIAIVLMLLGATNFVLHTFLLRGKWKQFFKDIEIRLAFWLILLFTVITTLSTLYLYSDGNVVTGLDFWTSLRYSVFNIVSSLTTTGFSNFSSVAALGQVAVFSGILMMAVGGGMGSTSGAIKQYRFAIILKDFQYSIRYRFSSSHQVNPNPVYRLGELREEDSSTSDEAHNYTLLYLLFFLIGAVSLMFLPGISVSQGAYDYMSALSGTGLDIINFYAYKLSEPAFYPALLWILSAGMFIGRLEILPAYYALKRLFYDPFKNIKNRSNKPEEV
jgi:trk system potassium uptake protein TrkH